MRSFVLSTSSQNVAPDLVDLLVEEILAVPARVWKQTFAGLLAYDDQTELPLIETPTLLVWGDADATVGPSAARFTAGFVTGPFEFAVLPGIGHFLTDQDPEAVTRGLLSHLARHR